MDSGWAAELVWIFWKNGEVFCVLWDQFGNQKYKQGYELAVFQE